MLFALKSPLETGIPSITYKGCEPAEMEFVPRTFTFIEEPAIPFCVVTCTPAARPCMEDSRLGRTASPRSSELIDVTEYSLNADFSYYAIPKFESNVYLIGKITGWEALNLIDGEMNVYFGETYLGVSQLNTGSLNRITSYNVCYTKLLREIG